MVVVVVALDISFGRFKSKPLRRPLLICLYLPPKSASCNLYRDDVSIFAQRAPQKEPTDFGRKPPGGGEVLGALGTPFFPVFNGWKW